MTKQELVEKYQLCRCDIAYTSRELRDPACPWHSFAVEEAVDEYAKTVALAFMEDREGLKPEDMESEYDWFMKHEFNKRRPQ